MKNQVHQRVYTTDIQVFCHSEIFFQVWEDTTTTETRRTPHLFQNRFTSVFLHKPVTNMFIFFVLDETLILNETMVHVVWCKEKSSTQSAVSF